VYDDMQLASCWRNLADAILNAALNGCRGKVCTIEGWRIQRI
jgi:hypothetical protein